MVTTNFVQNHHLQNSQFFLLPKRQLVTYALYALIPLALLHYLLFNPVATAKKPVVVVVQATEDAASVIASSHREHVKVNAKQLPVPPSDQGDEVSRKNPQGAMLGSLVDFEYLDSAM
jgi:hypothetical protein